MNDKVIVNERAEPGSGVKHDKHAPKADADIDAAAIVAEAEAEVEAETEAEVEAETVLTENEKRAQETDKVPEAAPTKDFSKEQILAYCERQEIDIDSDWTQEELFDAVTELLENEQE